MIANEVPHQLNAILIVDDGKFNPVLAEEVFGSEEVLVFSDDDAGDAIEQRRTGAHDAGTEGADEDEFVPVSTAAGVANADSFGVSGGISGLDAKVVTSGYDASIACGKDGADGESALAKSSAGFRQRFQQKSFMGHEGESFSSVSRFWGEGSVLRWF